jgi:hypothetical protein
MGVFHDEWMFADTKVSVDTFVQWPRLIVSGNPQSRTNLFILWGW